MSKKIVNFSGDNIQVSWDGRLCIHVAECGKAQGELFIGGRKPWCQPNLVSITEVEEVVLRCPTGALTYQHNDSSNPEQAKPENTINISSNGPLFLNGELEIKNVPNDAPGVKFRAALCRCGQSKNKPFCDNRHEDTEFNDYGAAAHRPINHFATVNIKRLSLSLKQILLVGTRDYFSIFGFLLLGRIADRDVALWNLPNAVPISPTKIPDTINLIRVNSKLF